MKNMLRVTQKATTDESLQSEVVKMVKSIKSDGIPKTLEGLQSMYSLYNQMFGKNKKLTNCVYCRINVAESLEKAVLLLELKESRTTKSQSNKTTPKKRTTKKATTKKTTRKRTTRKAEK